MTHNCVMLVCLVVGWWAVSGIMSLSTGVVDGFYEWHNSLTCSRLACVACVLLSGSHAFIRMHEPDVRLCSPSHDGRRQFEGCAHHDLVWAV